MIAHWNRRARRPRPARSAHHHARGRPAARHRDAHRQRHPARRSRLRARGVAPGRRATPTDDRPRCCAAPPTAPAPSRPLARPQLGHGAALLTAPVLPVGRRGPRSPAGCAGPPRPGPRPRCSATSAASRTRWTSAEAGRAHAVWFSAPARMPRGLTVTTASTAGRLHLALRWSRALLGHGDGARLRDLFAHYLHATDGWTSPARPAVPPVTARPPRRCGTSTRTPPSRSPPATPAACARPGCWPRALGPRHRRAAATVLDIGCGDGSAAATAAPVLAGHRIVGVDWSQDALRRARTRIPVCGTRRTHRRRAAVRRPAPPTPCCSARSSSISSTPTPPWTSCAGSCAPGGHLMLSTPNLAAWYNRGLLLAGVQPVFSEVSLRGIHGRPGTPGRRPSAALHRPCPAGVPRRVRLRGRTDRRARPSTACRGRCAPWTGRLRRAVAGLDPAAHARRAKGVAPMWWGVAAALLANVLYSTGFVLEKRALAGAARR